MGKLQAIVVSTVIVVVGIALPIVLSGHRRETIGTVAHAVVRESKFVRLIDQLADDKFDGFQKTGFINDLGAGGLEAIPYLIDALADARICFQDYVPANNSCPGNEMKPRPWTVGEQCKGILVSYILRICPFCRYDRQISDWSTWWMENRGRSMVEIKAEILRWELANPHPGCGH